MFGVELKLLVHYHADERASLTTEAFAAPSSGPSTYIFAAVNNSDVSYFSKCLMMKL